MPILNDEDRDYDEVEGVQFDLTKNTLETFENGEGCELRNMKRGSMKRGSIRPSTQELAKRRLSKSQVLMKDNLRRKSILPGDDDDEFWFDPTLASPIKARTITDIVCFLLFFIFIAGWVFVIYVAFTMGDIRRFTVATTTTDDKIQRCGYDMGIVRKTHQLNLKFVECLKPSSVFKYCDSTSICVRDCPSMFFSYEYYKRTNKSLDEMQRALICRDGFSVKSQIDTMNKAKKYIDEKWCANIYMKSLNETPVSEYLGDFCLPDVMGTSLEVVLEAVKEHFNDFFFMWHITLFVVEKTKLDQFTVSETIEGYGIILGFLGFSLFVCLLVTFVMKILARQFLYVTFFGTLIIFAFALYNCFQTGYVVNNIDLSTLNTESIYQELWGWILIVSSIVVVLVLVAYFSLKKYTSVAIELIRESSIAINRIKTTIGFPLSFWLFQTCMILFTVIIGIYIKSIESKNIYKLTNFDPQNCSCTGVAANYKNDDFCNPRYYKEFCSVEQCRASCDEVKNNIDGSYIEFIKSMNLMGFFFSTEYLSLLSQAILASTFATYYWTFFKADIPKFTLYNGMCRIIVYHLGTITFAWLFLSVYAYIRFTFDFINSALNLIPFSLIHFFFKYILILSAISGEDFVQSSKEVVRLIKQHYMLIIVIKCTGVILFTLIEVLLTTLMGSIMYGLLQFPPISEHFVHKMFPIYFVCVGTFYISTVVFDVYLMALDTLTFCFIEDYTINDGDKTSPYFMTKRLKKIWKVQNILDDSSYDCYR